MVDIVSEDCGLPFVDILGLLDRWIMVPNGQVVHILALCLQECWQPLVQGKPCWTLPKDGASSFAIVVLSLRRVDDLAENGCGGSKRSTRTMCECARMLSAMLKIIVGDVRKKQPLGSASDGDNELFRTTDKQPVISKDSSKTGVG